MPKSVRWPWLLLPAVVVAVLLVAVVAYRLGQARPALVAQATGTATPALPRSQTPAPTVSNAPTNPPTVQPTNTPTVTPTPVPSPTPIITALPPIPQGFLVSARQPVQVVQTYDNAPDWWPRFPPFSALKSRFTLVAYSEVLAGVDFAQVRDGDVVRRGTAVTITLPGPELYGRPSIDASQSYVIEQPGLSPRALGKVIAAQADLQDAAANWALQHGLLSRAGAAAQDMVELWFRRLGFAEVTVLWDYARRPPGDAAATPGPAASFAAAPAP